ncbi:MAG: hypothetical protein LBG21_02905 [Campylobacteraceae bacterium]|nr:hypothetical protein [Campylobacteraceae bacterium]
MLNITIEGKNKVIGNLQNILKKLKTLEAKSGVVKEEIHPAKSAYGIHSLRIPKRDSKFQPAKAKTNKAKASIKSQAEQLNAIDNETFLEKVAMFIQNTQTDLFRSDDWIATHTVKNKGSSTTGLATYMAGKK